MTQYFIYLHSWFMFCCFSDEGMNLLPSLPQDSSFFQCTSWASSSAPGLGDWANPAPGPVLLDSVPSSPAQLKSVTNLDCSIFEIYIIPKFKQIQLTGSKHQSKNKWNTGNRYVLGPPSSFPSNVALWCCGKQPFSLLVRSSTNFFFFCPCGSFSLSETNATCRWCCSQGYCTGLSYFYPFNMVFGRSWKIFMWPWKERIP